MNKTIGFIAICATAAVLALPLSAKKPGTVEAALQAQAQCSTEAKAALYTEFRANYKGDQAKAYDAAKKYIACPADPADTSEPQRVDYLKKYIVLYEKQNRKDQLFDLVYGKKDYAKAFETGKQVLVDDPEYVRAYIDLAYAGYSAAVAGNQSFQNDSINYAKKALEMVEAGKAPENWKPFTSKDETLAWLNYISATFKIGTAPVEAIPFLIKTATLEGPFKKSAQTYALLGQAYEIGIYAKQSEEYNKLYKDKPETPESKLALENINQVIDRMIDAHARAVALAGTDPKTQKIKDESMQSLTQWYKYRHNESVDGLNEMVAAILSKPLPPVPTPITSLPASAPGTSPATGATNATGTGAAATQPAGTPGSASSTAQPKTDAAAAPTNTPKPNTPKTSSATNPRPKPRRNHRQR